MSTPQTQTTAAKNTDKKASTPPPPPASDAKATDAKATTTAPASTTPTPTPAAATDGTPNSNNPPAVDTEPKERQKVYIVVGEVHEFKNASEAEKFLNKDAAAPQGDYTVIKGKKVERKAKVSLR
jgi:hypothetical protein